MIHEFRRVFPWLVIVLAICFLMFAARPSPHLVKSQYDLRRFAALPVIADGRTKPLDTVARTSLMLISGRQTFTTYKILKSDRGDRKIIDESGLPAIRWFLDVATRPDDARSYEVFRVDHPDVLAIFGKSNEDGTRYSFNSLIAKKEDFLKQVEQAQAVAPKSRNQYQKAVLELYGHLMLFNKISLLETPFVIPPTQPGEEWMTVAAVYERFQNGEVHPTAVAFTNVLTAYHDSKPDDFNRALDAYEAICAKALPAEVPAAQYEVFFSNWEVFYQATILYVVAFLLGCTGLLIHASVKRKETGWAQTLTTAAAWLVIFTFAVHTLGLASRIYLQGRPPVTNLYSSAIFIGWACVLLCLFLERIHKLGLGSIVAGVIGFATLIIAHNLALLPSTGDTLQMMEAVLDSNFWLSTHVITVTLGYSATFLAGFLAILYIFLGLFTRFLTADISKTFVKMVYGVIAFALLLSFVGTVLGGIWADQSWGRFWGWDPKENGAVLIVLMNALILHARWAGLIKDRGLMALAVAGNIVTSWSWFGTNLLGVGLHAYGFMESAPYYLLVFVGSQLFIIGLALLPERLWRSKQTAKLAAKQLT